MKLKNDEFVEKFDENVGRSWRSFKIIIHVC